MTNLSSFPITKKWPPRFADRLQLYSLTTPNGVKASIMLEEIGLPYEAHYVNFDTNDQGTEEFRSLNPYGKIPALIDPNGPDGAAPSFIQISRRFWIYLGGKKRETCWPPGRLAGNKKPFQGAWAFSKGARGPGPKFFEKKSGLTFKKIPKGPGKIQRKKTPPFKKSLFVGGPKSPPPKFFVDLFKKKRPLWGRPPPPKKVFPGGKKKKKPQNGARKFFPPPFFFGGGEKKKNPPRGFF